MTIPTDLVKAVTPLSTIKVVVVTILSVIGVILLSLTLYLFSELKDAKESNGALKAENATLSRDMELIRIGRTAMGMGQILSDQEKADLDKKARDTRTALKLKEQQIAKAPISEEEKSRQTSEVRMESVWAMYCHIQPDNSACQVK